MDEIKRGSMTKKRLIVDIPEDLYNTFLDTVTERGGHWRSQEKAETFSDAVESAVVAALMLFLQGLDKDVELPEFREYISEKYPFLSEDLITMMADLIEREKERLPKKV